MLTLSKHQIGDWLLLDHLARKQVFEDKIRFYVRKHGSDFQAFEQRIETAETDDFEAWDDYIEWKAYEHFLTGLNQHINDIRHGHFQVA